MRKMSSMFVVFAACVFLSPTKLLAEEGQLKDKIVKVLEANRHGECPGSVMAPVLLDICEQQVEIMRKRLAQLGSITKVQYRVIEKLPNGVDAEAYKFYFENGSMMWLATAGGDGKLNFMWSPG